LGALARSGFTEVRLLRGSGRAAGDGREAGATPRHADAVRVVPAHGAADAVRHLVPWFADGPAARLTLSRAEADVEIGGGPSRVTAELRPLRPADVRGQLRVKSPRGVEVKVPGEITLPRGTKVDVPVDITVPAGTRAGTYEVPVSFGGESRTVTVRAVPRTAGPDLARGARADSSGDETKDFPASAAVDGDPRTRWSSPAEDGAWWQVELAGPVRLGEVVLHWQDAYAARYRVQTSADGRTWRTAATVRHGRGGREAVRMDARDTRYVRVRGDRRATRFGYSLWSVEAYAVAGE
ncbi:discoidin domain-containing protein, partial [Streptomyces sp. NPDC005918]|uniref:discoidin domain-containing protein n=1 Tax=Streptomyces sp. NPDC005918 TaxID=3155454 RepID=UPI0033C40329